GQALGRAGPARSGAARSAEGVRVGRVQGSGGRGDSLCGGTARARAAAVAAELRQGSARALGVLAEPAGGLCQTLLELDARLPAESAAGCRRIDAAPALLAGRGRSVAEVRWKAESCREPLRERDHVAFASGADIQRAF